MRVQSQPIARIREGTVTLVVATLAIAVLAGCGGSDDEVDRDKFIAEADAVCAGYTADATSLEDQFNEALRSRDLEAAAEDFESQASEVTAMLDQLEDIEPPIADQTTVDRLIAIGRQRVAVAEEAASAIASGNKDAMLVAGKKGSVLAGEYYQLADSFGFAACGSSAAAEAAAGSGATGATS